ALTDDTANSDLRVIPAGHLFGVNVARVAFKRSAYLRNFVYKFAELINGKLDRALITRAMAGRLHEDD
ncbi:MAG: transcriptional regulator, partial [Polaromonas sp.]|nr:transcriptional regulator [Polaromonas sp.]